MTTARSILGSVYRKLNVTAIGTQPNTAQLNEGLTELNGFLRIIFGSQLGELLRDWEAPFSQRTAPVAANFPQNPYPLNQDSAFLGSPSSGAGSASWPYPPKNSRLIFGATEDATVYFPEQPDDGARMGLLQGALAGAGVTLTLDGNGRTINGAATQTFTTPFTGARWIYRADLADWRPLADLALDDEMPLPEDMDDFAILSLAVRVAPNNDKSISPELAEAYKQAKSIFQARYRQEGTTVSKGADIPLAAESYLGGRGWW